MYAQFRVETVAVTRFTLVLYHIYQSYGWHCNWRQSDTAVITLAKIRNRGRLAPLWAMADCKKQGGQYSASVDDWAGPKRTFISTRPTTAAKRDHRQRTTNAHAHELGFSTLPAKRKRRASVRQRKLNGFEMGHTRSKFQNFLLPPSVSRSRYSDWQTHRYTMLHEQED